MRQALYLSALLLLQLSACTAAAPLPPIDSLDAGQILQQMGTVYANARSYRDSGMIEEVVQTEGMTITTEKPFQIAFQRRPARFRFEFTEEQGLQLADGTSRNAYIVWRRGNDIRSWWDIRPNQVIHANMEIALAGPTGISRGAAFYTPALLLPEEVDSPSFFTLANPTRLDDAPCGDFLCARIQGTLNGGTYTVWLDRHHYLIRQVQQDVASPRGSRYFYTLYYAPELNVPMSAEELAFGAPES